MRPSFQAVAALALLGMAIAASWLAIGGIIDGSVVFPSSKRAGLELHRDASPKGFWTCIAVWFAAAGGFAWLALVNLREAVRAS